MIAKATQKYLFAPENLKDVEVNNFKTEKSTQQKKFMKGLQNAHDILNSLERSFSKTNKYEEQLLRCKSSHSHSHCQSSNEWWDSEEDKNKCSKTETTKFARNPVNLVESWSTMSIVCLQYQYEELSKKYESLLREYDNRCKALNNKDASLKRLKQHASEMHARLTRAHTALLSIGEKYLALKQKEKAQRNLHKEMIHYLKEAVKDAINSTERARCDLEAHIASNK